MLSKEQTEELCLQIVVLSNLLEEKLEELQKTGVLVQQLKLAVKNTREKLSSFIKKVFYTNDEDFFKASAGTLLMQQKVEKVIQNEFILSVEEREDRLKEILKEHPLLYEEEILNILTKIEEQNILKF